MTASAHTESPPSTRHTAPSCPEPDSLQSYVRNNVLAAVAALVLLLAAVGLVSRYYEPELLAATSWVYGHLGVAGLGAILLVSDSFITPVPPDLLLVVVASSDLHAHWWLVIPFFGIISSAAGNIAWYLSRRLGHTRVPTLLLGRFRERNRALVARYGTIAVALGALTPIPFSITCWTAGLFQLPFRAVAAMTLLRIPRFYLYYLLIATIAPAPAALSEPPAGGPHAVAVTESAR